MRSPAAALALVVVGLAAPAVVSIGCGGAEWKPVAGPTVFPAMPAVERHEAQAKRHPRERHDDAASASPSTSASAAAPSASAGGSASAKPATSAKPPKAPPPPKKK